MIVICEQSRDVQIRLRTFAALVATALACAGPAACASAPGGPAGDRLRVVAGFYPLQFIAEQVGGDRVIAKNLAKPGAEPHDMELTTAQTAQIADADLVVYLAGFQPAVDDAVKQEAEGSTFDAAAVAPLLAVTAPDDNHDRNASVEPTSAAGEGAKDPHLWLDPIRLAAVADALAARLATADPAGAAGFRERAAALRSRLANLDAQYRQGLKTCQRREIVVSHAAFGYLADRYGLKQVAITGLAPEEEPTPQRLAEVATEAKGHGATTIFFETLVSPKVAKAIADEVGASTAVLDPIEGLPAGSTDDYFSVMRANLATLRPALGCA